MVAIHERKKTFKCAKLSKKFYEFIKNVSQALYKCLSKWIKVDKWGDFQNGSQFFFLFSFIFLNMKPLSEVAPGFLVIQIQIQAVCTIKNASLIIQRWAKGYLPHPLPAPLINKNINFVPFFITGWLYRKKFIKVKNASMTIQRWARGYLARRKVIYF